MNYLRVFIKSSYSPSYHVYKKVSGLEFSSYMQRFLPPQVGRIYRVPLCYTFMFQVHVMSCLNTPDGSLVLTEIRVISPLKFSPPR